MIGGALVGTFLGVLLAYGIFGPIATRLQGIYDDEIKFYHVIRVIITAHLHGQAPQISVETGERRSPMNTCRASRKSKRS